MASLPWDVIEDILCRLPVKDLLRLRNVSKPWRSMIDGPDFIKKHLNRSMETSSNLGFVLTGHGQLYWTDLDSLGSAVELNHPREIEGYFGIKILGSCNGLLVLYNRLRDMVLWSPSTRSYIPFPIATTDCTFQNLVYGFGYDPINDDYKLVRIMQFVDYEVEVKVFDVKSNNGKVRTGGFPYCLNRQTDNGVLTCNALHWVFSSDDFSSDALLVKFDLVTEEFSQVPQPDYGDSQINLTVFEGSLCVICDSLNDFEATDIWVMKEYGVRESWTKLFSLVTSVRDSFDYVDIVPLAYLKNGKEILLYWDAMNFICYDLENKKAKNVIVSGAPYSFQVHLCVGSLVQLNVGGGDSA